MADNSAVAESQRGSLFGKKRIDTVGAGSVGALQGINFIRHWNEKTDETTQAWAMFDIDVQTPDWMTCGLFVGRDEWGLNAFRIKDETEVSEVDVDSDRLVQEIRGALTRAQAIPPSQVQDPGGRPPGY